jgi:hypothetical protein
MTVKNRGCPRWHASPQCQQLVGQAADTDRFDSLCDGIAIVARVDDEGPRRFCVGAGLIEAPFDASGQSALDLDRPERAVFGKVDAFARVRFRPSRTNVR